MRKTRRQELIETYTAALDLCDEQKDVRRVVERLIGDVDDLFGDGFGLDTVPDPRRATTDTKKPPARQVMDIAEEGNLSPPHLARLQEAMGRLISETIDHCTNGHVWRFFWFDGVEDQRAHVRANSVEHALRLWREEHDLEPTVHPESIHYEFNLNEVILGKVAHDAKPAP